MSARNANKNSTTARICKEHCTIIQRTKQYNKNITNSVCNHKPNTKNALFEPRKSNQTQTTNCIQLYQFMLNFINAQRGIRCCASESESAKYYILRRTAPNACSKTSVQLTLTAFTAVGPSTCRCYEHRQVDKKAHTTKPETARRRVGKELTPDVVWRSESEPCGTLD